MTRSKHPQDRAMRRAYADKYDRRADKTRTPPPSTDARRMFGTGSNTATDKTTDAENIARMFADARRTAIQN